MSQLPDKRGMVVVVLVTACALIGGALGAAGQSVRRADSQLVLVDVVVPGDEGTAGNLTVHDFRLLDRGDEQPITFFEAVSGAPDPATAIDLPPGVTSNRRDHQGLVPASATVILIDRVNTETDAQIFINDELLRHLEASGGRDGIAIYELGSNLRVLYDFTDDPAGLIEVARGLEPEHSLALASSDSSGGFEAGLDSIGIDREFTDGIEGDPGFGRQSSDYFLNDRALRTSLALDAITRRLAGLEGRKNLIWLSGRFPFAFDARRRSDLANEVENSTLIQMENIGAGLIDANIAIYPVDVRGPGGEGADVGNIREHLAVRTGGRTFLSNGVGPAIETAMADAETTYTLGFYPSEPVTDRGFRGLRVEVVDRPSLDVLHREGYFGSPAEEPAVRVGVAEILSSPLDATGIGLTAVVAASEGGAGPFQLIAALDAQDLGLVSIGGRRLGVVDLALLFRAADDGTIFLLPTESQPVNLTEEQYQNSEAAFIIQKVIDTEGRAGMLRVAVQDQKTGRAGSVWVPVGTDN